MSYGTRNSSLKYSPVLRSSGLALSLTLAMIAFTPVSSFATNPDTQSYLGCHRLWHLRLCR